MDTKELLRTLCAPDGNSGSEKNAAAVAAELLSKYGETETDRLGSVICRVAPAKNGRSVMLDAHLDQIALIVTHIDSRGFVYVMPCGGIDRRSIAGTRVRILGKDGEYVGVVCTLPPHLQGDGKKENLKPDELAIDVGFNKSEAEKRIRLGDRAMMCGKFSAIGDGYVTSPALDDRAGCACIIEALELLSGKDLPCGLTAVFSCREETGGEGAAASAFSVAPTEALEMDVSFGQTPDTDEVETKQMKKGPMVGFAPALDGEISEKLISLAEKHGIPCQREVMGGETGTNADDIAKEGTGVRCGMLSIPQQYMHTVIEKVAVEDVQNVGRLIAAYVMEGGAD